MTDHPTRIEALPPAALIAFELWDDTGGAARRLADALGGALPDPGRSTSLAGGWRAIRIEPTVWWLSGPLTGLEDRTVRLTATLGEEGAVTDLTGGFVRLAAGGPGWRTLLMFGGVFDAEDPAFDPGATVGTILHHVAVRYDVAGEDLVHIHVAQSYAVDLLAQMRTAAEGLGHS